MSYTVWGPWNSQATNSEQTKEITFSTLIRNVELEHEREVSALKSEIDGLKDELARARRAAEQAQSRSANQKAKTVRIVSSSMSGSGEMFATQSDHSRGGWSPGSRAGKKDDAGGGEMPSIETEEDKVPPTGTIPLGDSSCVKLTGNWDTPADDAASRRPSSSTMHRSKSSASLRPEADGSFEGGVNESSLEVETGKKVMVLAEKADQPIVGRRVSGFQGRLSSLPSPEENNANVVDRSRLHISKMTRRGPDDDLKADRCMISPVSKTRLLWDCIAALVLLVDLWMTPFELVYVDAAAAPQEFTTVNWIITLFWMTDIMLNFTTGYIERDVLVLKRCMSIRKYLSCWFFVDLLATVPFDLILGAASQVNPKFLTFTRLSKVSKALKTIRFLKVVRATRLMQNMDRAQYAIEEIPFFGAFIRLMVYVSILFAVSHIHGCVWALVQPERRMASSMKEALANYVASLQWAVSMLALGEPGREHGEDPQDDVSTRTLEMFVSVERLIALTMIGASVMTKAITAAQEEAHFEILKNSAMRFFRKHNVSVETQIQVLYCLFETRAAQTMQRHFRQLVSENLPEELRRTVCEELWVTQLLSLGLLVHVKEWHADFLTELSLIVREEVLASKTILCKEGSAAHAAYYILQGCLVVISTGHKGRMADFSEGMWVGEQSFLGPNRRRNGTIVARVLTRLMVVPAEGFRELLTKLGLLGRFQNFRETHLEQGLCGRCGGVGDHFTHVCPVASRLVRPARRSRTNVEWLGTRINFGSKGEEMDEGENTGEMQLQSFLHAHRLLRLLPILNEHGVFTLEALDTLDFAELEFMVDTADDEDEVHQQLEELQALQEERMEARMHKLSEEETSSQHLAFLSHFKIESGTEAALMRAELENALREDGQDGIMTMFSAPIFLDSEDLYDLADLQERVRNSHNVVLLLSQNVLTRPWVLIELVTAMESGVRVLPVEVMKPGTTFTFPDEAFYQSLHRGEILDEKGQALLKENGLDLSHVETALRQVFKKIAVPYSPHRPESIRKAEVRTLLKQVRLRSADLPSNAITESQALTNHVGHLRTSASHVSRDSVCSPSVARSVTSRSMSNIVSSGAFI